MSPKPYSVPIDPSAVTNLYLFNGPTFYGMTNPHFSLPAHLKATAIVCILFAFFCCGGNYFALTSKESSQSSVRASRAASSKRAELGYGWYAVRLVLLCLVYGAAITSLFYLAIKELGMNNHLPSIHDLSISVLLAASITVVGILLQSLALDFYYGRQEAR